MCSKAIIDDGIYPPCSRDRSVRNVHILGTRQILDVAVQPCLLRLTASLESPFLIPRIFSPRFDLSVTAYGICHGLKIELDAGWWSCPIPGAGMQAFIRIGSERSDEPLRPQELLPSDPMQLLTIQNSNEHDW